MQVVAFDLETYLITKTNKAPKPVCATICSDSVNSYLLAPDDRYLRDMLFHPDLHWVGQNVAYDIVLHMRWHPWSIPAWIRALDEGRVHDTMIREQLGHLEQHGGIGYPYRCSLTMLEQKYLGIDRSDQKKGEDIWRLRYGTLDGVPFDQWPAEAKQYALDDAVNTHRVFMAQGGVEGAYPTEDLQNRAAVALQAISAWGFYVNQDHVTSQRDKLVTDMAELEKSFANLGITGSGSKKKMADLVLAGWYKVHCDELYQHALVGGITIDWQKLAEACPSPQNIKHWLGHHSQFAYQQMPGWCYDAQQWNPPGWIDQVTKRLSEVPYSKTGPKTGEDEIKPILEYIPALKDRAEWKHKEKMLGTYIRPFLGNRTANSRFQTVVTTGRTAATDPPMQTIPRFNKKRPEEQFRKNCRARPGCLLGTVDYSGLELATLAATILARYGKSKMADMINDDYDLHCFTASGIVSIPYEQILANKKQPEMAENRQGAKAANFGLPGGLGPKAFQAYLAAKPYYIVKSFGEVKQIINGYRKQWPEVVTYLSDAADAVDNSDGRRATSCNNSGRKKANCTYTEYANYPFQSLAADGCKAAMWEIFKQQMLGWFWTEGSAEIQAIGASYGSYGSAYSGNPLRRSHLVNMVHDELVCEHPQDLAEEAYKLQTDIMVSVMRQYTVGVNTKVEGELGVEWEH